MAEGLQEEDSFKQDYKLRLGVAGFFLAGLFLLAVGAGLFFFKNSSKEDEIQIIATTEGTESRSTEIVVHVDGAVVVPGVYKLPNGSRVGEAVTAAGGFAEDADKTRINLAAKLADGQKIYVFAKGEQVTSDKGQVTSQDAELININTASESELDKLPGVGPVTVQKIIASRPYSALDDLLSKKVVNKSTYEKIKDLITY